MNYQDKVEIVNTMIGAHYRLDNEYLTKLLTAKTNEAAALRARLSRMTTLYNMACRQIASQHAQLDDLHHTEDLLTEVAMEYFVNAPERRVAWEPYLSFDSEEFNAAVIAHDAFGDVADYAADRDRLRMVDNLDTDVESEDEDELMREIQELIHRE